MTPLSKLLHAAAEALDVDLERSRDLLGQACVLLQTRTASQDGPAQAALAPWQAKRVVRHVEENLDRPLPIDELSRMVGLSNSYFSRAFKATFGQTPHAFILGRRVERARQEMLEGREPLCQIALSCGFADQAHLARTFRRQTGLAPSEWRRAHRPVIATPGPVNGAGVRASRADSAIELQRTGSLERPQQPGDRVRELVSGSGVALGQKRG
jgi:AraC-like DNA-binding protein